MRPLPATSYLRIARAALRHDQAVYAHFGVTHRCGLTCRMCGIWRYGNEKEELSLDQVAVVAEHMAAIGVAQVALGGGEPFERRDLPDIVRIFVERGLVVRTLTNGVTTPWDALDRCIDAGGLHWSVSLDTLHPERYDWICEQPESWTRGVRTLLRIAERTLPQGGLPVVNCVVSNLNLEELPDIVRFVAHMGCAVSFLPVELLADAKAGVRNWEARFVRYRPEMGLDADPERVKARIDRAYDVLVAMKAEGWPILNSTPYLEASRRYLQTGRFPQQDGRTCDAGRLYFSVAPNGQFTVCHRKEYDHESFVDPGFLDYWRSDAYREAAAAEAASCEGCMRACWIDTTYTFHTVQGFFETARTTLRSQRRHRVPPFEEMLGWARWTGPVVPETSAAK